MKSGSYFYSLRLTIGLLLISAGGLTAQTQLSTQVDKQTITIGDPILIKLVVQQLPQGSTIVWPKPEPAYAGLELLDTTSIDTVGSGIQRLFRQEFILSAYDSGSFVFPALKVIVLDAQQVPTVFYSDSLVIQVQTLAVDTTRAFKPIKDIVPVKSSWLDYWQVIVGLILFLTLLAFVGYYFYKNRKVKAPAAEAVTPPEKAHEKALRLLSDLEHKQYGQQGEVKMYYSALSDILRNYLDDRFELNCMEQTTDELMALLKKQTDERAGLRKVRPELKKLLQTADLVKFAKADPGPAEQQTSMEVAIKVVTTTQMKQEEGSQ